MIQENLCQCGAMMAVTERKDTEGRVIYKCRLASCRAEFAHGYRPYDTASRELRVLAEYSHRLGAQDLEAAAKKAARFGLAEAASAFSARAVALLPAHATPVAPAAPAAEAVEKGRAIPDEEDDPEPAAAPAEAEFIDDEETPEGEPTDGDERPIGDDKPPDGGVLDGILDAVACSGSGQRPRKGKCQKCGRRVRTRADGTAMKH